MLIHLNSSFPFFINRMILWTMFIQDFFVCADDYPSLQCSNYQTSCVQQVNEFSPWKVTFWNFFSICFFHVFHFFLSIFSSVLFLFFFFNYPLWHERKDLSHRCYISSVASLLIFPEFRHGAVTGVNEVTDFQWFIVVWMTSLF